MLVVSDGSTDRTVEIAHGFDEISVIEFPQNRGYGAAIKEGWHQSSGSLLAFLDADGTCDPGPFWGDVPTGDRRLGRCRARFATDTRFENASHSADWQPFLCFFAGVSMRTSCYGYGQWYARCAAKVATTALSASRRVALHPLDERGALLNDLGVIVTPISYDERTGKSKLSVVRDDVRFLQTISMASNVIAPSVCCFAA